MVRESSGRGGLLTALICVFLVQAASAVPPGYERAEAMPAPEAAMDGRVPRAVARPIVSRSAAMNFSPMAAGGDDCGSAPVTAVPVGAPGSPITTVVNGDNSAASGPDACVSDLGWYEAFEIDKCATVTIDFCGQDPVSRPSYSALFDSCPCSTTRSADFVSRGVCGDFNIYIQYNALPPGTYWYPVYSSTTTFCENSGALCANSSQCTPPYTCEDPLHPYTMNITAEECTGACSGCMGGCCNTSTETCTDSFPDDCTGPDEVFSSLSCCQSECRAPGPTYDSDAMELLSHVPVTTFSTISTAGNDVWGYTTPRGHKYALTGGNGTTAFIRVTDPRNPVTVADIGSAASLWKDVRAYQGYAYSSTEASGGIQIFDIRQIDSGIVSLVGSLTQNGLQTSHTLGLNPDSGFLYLHGSNLGGGRLTAVSLADPASPQIVGSMLQSVYVHDALEISYTSGTYAGKEIAFCFCGGAGMRIVDITNKSNMFTMSSMTYPELAYCHQGWITEDRRYIIMDDELEEAFGNVSETTVYVVDVQNLSAPFVAARYTFPGCWIDHDLHIRGNRVYQAQYSAGLRVTDISNPLAPVNVAYFDTRPEDNIQDFFGVWGSYAFPERLVLASDIERGLFVLCDEPHRPIPSFTVSENPASAGTSITFDASSSTHCDPSKNVVSYEWDFDYDGVTFDVDATGVVVMHAYAAGAYTAALRVTDDAQLRSAAPVQEVSSLVLTITSACGNDSIELGEQCDGTSDAACENLCRPPGDPGGECTCAPPLPPPEDVAVVFPNDTSKVNKNRFISVVIPAGAAGQEAAIRVEMQSLAAPPQGPGTPSGRQFRYVTGFGDGTDLECSGSPNFGQAYNCGQLVCSDSGLPIYRDWGDMAGEILHITGDAVHANSTYAASLIAQSCGDTAAADTCAGSSALVIQTAVWGDHADAGGDPLALDDVANVIDISFTVDKLKDLATAFPEPRIWKKDEDPDPNGQAISILDVAFTVDAVKGLPYPVSFDITVCP